MSNTETMDNVFGGEGAADAGNANESSGRIAELERELQKQRVESGRLKKANEEIASLKEQLAQANARKAEEDAINALPEDIRNDIPSDFVRGMAAVNQAASAKYDAQIQELREENARRDRENFANRIEARFPGFLSSVGAGGEKNAAWVKYQQYNRESIARAYASCDYSTLAYHIERFCDEIGSVVPSGDGAFANPDPRTSNGGNPSTEGVPSMSPTKVYTSEEYSALEKQAESFRSRGQFAKYQEIAYELENILSEGRLKG